jgi:hypothetical protein
LPNKAVIESPIDGLATPTDMPISALKSTAIAPTVNSKENLRELNICQG